MTGLVGLIVLASGSFAGYVGSKLIVREDVLTTSKHILASQSLFRLGIAGNLLMMTSWLFYALLLYRMLRPVNRHHALAMLVLVIVSVPIFMLNQVNLFALLPLALSGQNEPMALFLELHRFGSSVAAIFFGLWLFPLGFLVLKSGYLPRILGVLLMVGTLGYLILFVEVFFFPGSEQTLWSNPFLVVTHLSELALLLWLLIRGVGIKEWDRQVSGGA
jgi:hypothetical protein